MEKVDFLVIGAGVVGLAITAELAQRFNGSLIVLLERHEKFGQETSSRNSEVIHSGIYYPVKSLKATLCVEGNQRLYKYCQQWEIPFKRIGKLIIARNSTEISDLEKLFYQGKKNGVSDLEILEVDQIRRLEPNIEAVAAIYSPSTGIIDSHTLMKRLEFSAKQNEALIAYQHEVIGIEPVKDGYQVTYSCNEGKEVIESNWVINCAGLASDSIASLMGIDIVRNGYQIYPCKGEYFKVTNQKAKMVSHLVYPPPLKELKGLGVHVTKSLDGTLRLGPNAFYVDTVNYSVNEEHKREFFEAVQSYLPFLTYSDIEPDTSGIRPKLQGPEEPFRDFIIRHEADRDLKGIINLVGIESPGLTSCLSIANYVSDLINKF